MKHTGSPQISQWRECKFCTVAQELCGFVLTAYLCASGPTPEQWFLLKCNSAETLTYLWAYYQDWHCLQLGKPKLMAHHGRTRMTFAVLVCQNPNHPCCMRSANRASARDMPSCGPHRSMSQPWFRTDDTALTCSALSNLGVQFPKLAILNLLPITSCACSISSAAGSKLSFSRLCLTCCT